MGEEAAAPLLGDVHLNINLHGDGDADDIDGSNRKEEEEEELPATANRRWTLGWDWEEAAGQLAFAAPMVATSMAYYAIPLVSVMYAGRLGDLQLAAATLGNSWGTVTGIALMEITSIRSSIYRAVPLMIRMPWPCRAVRQHWAVGTDALSIQRPSIHCLVSTLNLLNELRLIIESFHCPSIFLCISSS